MGRRPKNQAAIQKFEVKANYTPQALKEAIEAANNLPSSKRDYIINLMMTLGQLSTVTAVHTNLIKDIKQDIANRKAEFRQSLAASEPVKMLKKLETELLINEAEYNACLAKFDGIAEEIQLMIAHNEFVDDNIKALIA